MRPHLVLSVVLAAGSLAACDWPRFGAAPDVCLRIEAGDCQDTYGGPSGLVTVLWIAGLPYDKVGPLDPLGGSWEELLPGDSVTLYLVYGQYGPMGGTDTVRTVAWEVTNAAVARISAATGGRGTLVATAPGVFGVTANGTFPVMWACGTDACTLITRLRVVAPPTPAQHTPAARRLGGTHDRHL
jgi:hypothetical protein